MSSQLKYSKRSILPHWDAQTYTKIASRSYHQVTNLTGWQKNLEKHALTGLPPCKILDIGCGTGFVLNMLQENGFMATGVDPSDGMLEKASDIYGFTEETLINASVCELPFTDNSFEAAIASGSLVHVAEISTAISEITRVLEPGAKLRIIDHASPKDKTVFTPLTTVFTHLSGDIIHDYEALLKENFSLISRETLGRAGYLQKFDFIKN